MTRNTLQILFGFIVLTFFSASLMAMPDILIKGLFKNAAVVVIDGRQQLLKVGESSDAGVTLVSASSKGAVIEYEGVQKTLTLTQGISSSFSEASKTEVRLVSQHNGHFFGSALFNGKRAQFLVDTGASSVAMSSKTAKMLGIRYQQAPVVRVDTAEGRTLGYQVKLRRVELGGIRVNNVAATVLEGEYPLDILLGNSFLGKLDMNIDSGVLVLKSKY